MEAPLARRILEISGAHGLGRVHEVARLWGGYGRILRVELDGGPADTVVVKVVAPPDERGQRSDRGDARKRRSYDVELAWYRSWAARAGAHPRVARAYGAERFATGWLFVLEDLAVDYPESLRGRDARGLDACLGWLAALHARFLGEPPTGLWPVGTYWHLATRPDELARMRDRDLARAAPEIDRRLSSARHRTIVHGDAKPENFCAARGGGAVAAVDFQYVGGGVGVKDVAYLLHGSSERVEAAGRDRYLDLLGRELEGRADVDRRAVIDEWRELYPLARADFERFLDGWGG